MTFAHLDQVLAEVAPLGRLFAKADRRLFLVGGIVRDQWLDQPLDTSSDIDLTTDALPVEIKRIVASFAEVLWTQGERFGTIGLQARGRAYEITTFRAENYASDSRKPQVSFGDNIETDLSRRDFTVNAMAIELPNRALVDPCGGVADLEAGRLRTPLSADISFSDDPLRMLRAARFATKYALAPNDELINSATALHERLRIVAIERIGIELRRLLDLGDPTVGLTFLADTGLLAEVLAYGQLELLDRVNGRRKSAIEVATALGPDWHLRLAAIGIAVFDAAAEVHAMCRRLRLSRDDERRITRVAAAALAVTDADHTSADALRRWITSSDDQPGAIALARVIAPDVGAVDAFATAAQQLMASEDFADVRFLDGATIMSLLAIEAGPEVGQAQIALQEHYFAHGPLSPTEQGNVLRSWWATQTSD